MQYAFIGVVVAILPSALAVVWLMWRSGALSRALDNH